MIIDVWEDDPKLLDRKNITATHKINGAKRIKRPRHVSESINTNTYLVSAHHVLHRGNTAKAAPQNESKDHNSKLPPSGLLCNAKDQAGDRLEEDIYYAP